MAGASPQGGDAPIPLTERVRALYENSVVPVREIAQLAGITERTLYKYVQKGGWRRRQICIARGAGVEPQEISALLKQYDFMAPMMRQMAGEGLMGRLKKVRELQEGGMLNPGAMLMREKKGTGKRLTSKEKADLRKQREKELRRRKRSGREGQGQ